VLTPNVKRKISLALTILATLAILFAIWTGIQSIVDWGESVWSCENGAWVKHGDPSAPKPDWECGGHMAALLGSGISFGNSQSSFRETGNLIGKSLDCMFVYENSGMPAMTVGLIHSSESRCIMNGVGVSCADARWNMGDRATAVGVLTGKTVSVSELNVLSTRRELSCPLYVNCMPGPDVNRTCIIPLGCEGHTQKAY